MRTRGDAFLKEALIVEEPFDAYGSPLWSEGAFTAQSRAAMLVARALDPQPGESVLDPSCSSSKTPPSKPSSPKSAMN